MPSKTALERAARIAASVLALGVLIGGALIGQSALATERLANGESRGRGVTVASEAGCVTETEYLKVAKGMTRATAEAAFGTTGVFTDGGAGGYARTYGQCASDTGSVVVYAVPVDGPPVVSSKKWRAPSVGSVRIFQRDAKDNDISLGQLEAKRRDHVYAGAGDDTIAMLSPDGYLDKIRCGAGTDTVYIWSKREKRDRFRSCEKFIYMPVD